MIWMLLCIVAGAGFGHIMRSAQLRHCAMPWVGALNYLLAAAACWAWWALSPGSHMSWLAAILGTLSGLGLVTAFFLMNVAIRSAGVGVTQSVQWLGVVIPIAASILFWREMPSLTQAVGVLLALTAFPLLACGYVPMETPRSRWKVAILVALFLLEGVVCLFIKVYTQRAGAGSESAFLSYMFSTAAVANVVMALRGARPKLMEFIHGFGMGASNILCNVGLLRALAFLPGTVVFPTTSAGGVVAAATIGMFLWRERYSGRSLAGLILATISLILVNL